MSSNEDASIVRPAQEILDEARRLVEPLHRSVVSGLPEPLARIAGYHAGWCTPDGTPEPASHGKSIRPALTVLSAQAFTESAQVNECALRAAVAIELVHDFSLLHDDVMDGDRMRRGRPAAWARFGVGPTILAGDMLLARALDLLAREPAANVGVRHATHAVVELCRGQSADLAFESRESVDVADAMRMVDGKTGALLGLACELGALAGGADFAQAELMRGFGSSLGRSFQLVDDLLAIWGDPAVTGKPVGADLARGKKSLPVVAALTSGTRAGERLAELLKAKHPLNEHESREAAELIEMSGARAWALDEADAGLRHALELLDTAVTDPSALTTIAHLIIRRDR